MHWHKHLPQQIPLQTHPQPVSSRQLKIARLGGLFLLCSLHVLQNLSEVATGLQPTSSHPLHPVIQAQLCWEDIRSLKIPEHNHGMLLCFSSGADPAWQSQSSGALRFIVPVPGGTGTPQRADAGAPATPGRGGKEKIHLLEEQQLPKLRAK